MPKRTATANPPSARGLVRSMVAEAIDFKEQLRRDLERGADERLNAARASLAADLDRGVSADEAADVLAQAVLCAGPILGSQPASWKLARDWFTTQSSDWERLVLEILPSSYSVLSTQYQVRGTECEADSAHLYEHFLHAWQRDTRKRRGVFFTPQPIAEFIVREIDRVLQGDFGLAQGLATTAAQSYREAHASRSPVVLDPACGTGVFLIAVIDHLHRQLGDRWNDFVPDLLPRFTGIEILPTAAFLAKLNIALKLAETNYRFHKPGKINIRCGDALDPNLQFEICNLKSAIPIVLGNPPFSSLSTNTNDWIARLVRGEGEIRGYVRAGGQSLGERKTWLHDDYVKFIRLAQWHVEGAGCGIVSYVTSHGYLDNATFRLMRQELMRVFPHIRIVDLHGSRKSEEANPDGSRDENVFGLDQGVAIGILTRSVSEGVPRVEHAELWGSRDEKLRALGAPSLTLRASVLTPESPHWRFVPSSGAAHAEYDAGWLLTDAMPVNTPAPVTARDHFVVGFTEEELRKRIEEFRDLSIPDEIIRQRYFTRTRSARYAPGDTRGWKLGAARQAVSADQDWRRRIVRCLYRPFDWRFVFWHPAMIDWPRNEVTRHLVSKSTGSSSKFKVQSSKLDALTLNLEPGTWNDCLIARRQQLPTQPCTFFWIADGLALDGVIRSDNRGSESLFPLYLFDNDREGAGQCRANFASAFIDQIQGRTGLAWQPVGRVDLAATFGPEDLLGFIYALFHSPTYRDKYAEQLRGDFPRVLLPRGAAQFTALSRLGQELIDLHVGRVCNPAIPDGLPIRPTSGDGSLIRPTGLAVAIQNFRVGGYVALKKWLQPPHRSPADPQYGQIAAAIGRTLEIMPAIDAALSAASTTSSAPECGSTKTRC